jgi:diguanylate cyclase (GGDEF)-like protein
VWQARNGQQAIPPGVDYCSSAVDLSLFSVRDSGRSEYAPYHAGKVTELVVGAPIYKGGEVPMTVQARQGAFIGWTGTEILPKTVLDTALQGHPDTGVVFRYGVGTSSATFRAGSAPRGSQVVTIDLHNGWHVQTFGVVNDGGVLANRNALALLLAGLSVSLLLGLLIYVLGTSRSRALQLVSERTDQLHHQAFHDSLTGLPNRALILDRTEHMLARARRLHTPIAALFLDLDNFKDINDTLGHEAGDELLAGVANRMASALRDGDTVGRLGGDEFVVLVEGISLAAGAEVVAERILDVLESPFEICGSETPLAVTASIGIAEGDRSAPGELLRDADIALYRAKAAGKHCAVTFSPVMQDLVDVNRDLDADLRRALEGDQFFLLYQPTIDLLTGTFGGVEALLRWKHPDRGVVLPDEFIPALEASGLIVPVGRWVLDRACQQGAEWQSQGHELTVSVNISNVQLERDRIIDDVSGALSASGFEPGSLILELTETTLMLDVEATVARLQMLKALGVRIAIDDFGTGYSSLAYLRQFPIDVLKIDQSFVSGVASTEESAAIVHTLVQLGKVLGLETVAEGIENEDQRLRLMAENVNVGQGFLFAHPLEADAVVQLLNGSGANPKSSAVQTIR